MNKMYLLIGGNLGEILKNLQKACEFIELRVGHIVSKSPVYETAAWGNTAQPAFLNQALLVTTQLSPLEALEAVLDIEQLFGRVRAEKFGPRIMDIDILFYNNLIFQSQSLTIPHPEIAKRRFVLVPLAAIAPELMEPVSGKTIKNLLAATADTLEVNLYKQKV